MYVYIYYVIYVTYVYCILYKDPTGTEFRTGTGTGTTSAIQYQALSPELVLDSATGTGTVARACKIGV